MNDIPNKREFSRVETMVIAEVAAEDGATAGGSTESLSLNGVFVMTETSLPEGSDCDVVLSLETGEENIRLKLRGKIVRVEPCGFALEFKDVAVDSLEHLRNLVRYNAFDADTVETEFGQHVGLKPRDSADGPA